jgi:hypothetical protein
MLSDCTDPYQPMEEECEITRRCIEVLAENGFPLLIATKSDLVTRDIDIYAIPNIDIEYITDREKAKTLYPFSLRTEIAIECKRSKSHAWVFYTRPHTYPPDYLYTDGAYRDNLEKGSGYSQFLFGKVRLHYDEFEEVAVAYDEVKIEKGRDKDSRRDIFGALNQLIKFIQYTMGPPKEQIREETFHILMFFPIVVFDGRMYKVQLEEGQPILSRAEHILVETHYRSPFTGKAEGFLVDIVHRSSLPDFMKLYSDLNGMRESIIEHHDEWLEEIQSIQQEYLKEKKS